MGHLLGYARISTGDQRPDLQVDALKGAGCYRVFVDTASGTLAARPALDQVLDQLRPGDTLVVWKLDRLGRSLRHLVDTIAALADRGVGFRSLQESIDTTTPGGKLVFHIFAALAEFERDLIRERTSAGLVAARARGRTAGADDRAQDQAGPGDVCLQAVHRGGDRQHAGGQPRVRLPPPRRPRRLTPWPRRDCRRS
jgi:DNA invertase Pin-like site-specific DNA recombinase